MLSSVQQGDYIFVELLKAAFAVENSNSVKIVK